MSMCRWVFHLQMSSFYPAGDPSWQECHCLFTFAEQFQGGVGREARGSELSWGPWPWTRGTYLTLKGLTPACPWMPLFTTCWSWWDCPTHVEGFLPGPLALPCGSLDGIRHCEVNSHGHISAARSTPQPPLPHTDVPYDPPVA